MFLFGDGNYYSAFTVISERGQSSSPFSVKEQGHGKQSKEESRKKWWDMGGCQEFPRTELPDSLLSLRGNSEELVSRR